MRYALAASEAIQRPGQARPDTLLNGPGTARWRSALMSARSLGLTKNPGKEY
jgi:hypothetical protein